MPDRVELSDERSADPGSDAATLRGDETKLSRRGFMGSAGLAAAGAAAGAVPLTAAIQDGGVIASAAAQAQPAPSAPAQKGPHLLKFPGKDEGLVVLGDRPLVAETPESLLDDDTTPTEKFFIRNNGQLPEPAADPDKWEITIDGEVDKTLKITLGELKSRFTPVTRRIVLECGGNGRSFFSPPARGNQWTNGGVGCPEWTGV